MQTVCAKIRGIEMPLRCWTHPTAWRPPTVKENGHEMSIRTHFIPCKLSNEIADALNRESGRIYTDVLVEHWRIWRRHGVWLSPYGAQKLNDLYDDDSPKLLHAHSVDAAQDAFYKACKTVKAARRAGADSRYPFRRKRFRTTIWKSTGIWLRGDRLRLALARSGASHGQVAGARPIWTKAPLSK